MANHLTTGLDATTSLFFIVMNRDSFESLDAEGQAAIEQIGTEVSKLASQTQLAAAQKGVEAFATSGKEVIELTPEQTAAFAELAATARDQVVAETAVQGLPAEATIAALRGE